MPDKYLQRRHELVKNGLSEVEACKISSNEYFIRHEKIPSEDPINVLDWLYNTLKLEGKLDNPPKIKNLFRHLKVKNT